MARPLILLLDGNSLVHRAYHAIQPLTSPSGEPTNATFGFASMLIKVLDDYKPAYVAAAWDIGRTFRHEQYAEYKGTRPPLPDDLRVQLDRARDVVAAFNLSSKTLEGYEADDILAALSTQAVKAGLDVLIVTGDTDTLQLVNPHVRVLLSGRKSSDSKIYDVPAIIERYGLKPAQLIDFKGLKGDSSDNIPGVKGVGEVTAKSLLQQFGSIDALYQHLEQVNPRLRNTLQENEAVARRSRGLVQLVHELPLSLDLEKMRVSDFDRAKVASLFRDLGFAALLQRLPKSGEQDIGQLSMFATPAAQATREVPTTYQLVDSPAALREVLANIRAAGQCAVDVETDSLHPVEANLVGIALSWQEGHTAYIPIGHKRVSDSAEQMPLEAVRQEMGALLADAAVRKVAHNANFDLIVLAQHELGVEGLQFDTLIGAWLLDPSGRALGLKSLAWQELGVEMTPIEDLIGSGKGQLSMDQVPINRAFPYAAADADMTLRLAKKLEASLIEKGLWTLFTTVEMPLVPVLIDMECIGVALDVPFLQQMSRELQVRLTELEDLIRQMVGYPINLNSSQQLSDALFDKLGLPTNGVPRGTSGRYSTAADVLEGLRGKHAMIDLLLEYRQLSKIKSTYADALPLLVNPKTGRLHTSWNQTGTVTGRVSSSEPNLQNIPIRTDIGRRVRRAFVARPGCVLLGADYSQVELRILAHVSGDESLLAAFQRGEDIHASTAASILAVPLEQVTQDMRRLAKAINFGLIYGMSDWGLATRTELSQEEASQFIAKYFARYPKVLEYLDEIKHQAAEVGFVETLLGRKRYFPELMADRKTNANMRAAAQRMAINHPIQGTAADIIKIAMIRLHKSLLERGLASRMILQVHDELVLEVPDDEVQQVSQLVKDTMEGAFELGAALKVDIKVGRHWGEME